MARLITWEPAREIAALHNEMSRVMNGLLEGNGRTTQSWVPAVDVWETDAELVYAFDLPGIPEDKVSLEYEDGSLTVSATRERAEEVKSDRFFRAERRFGAFQRTLGLPQGVSDNDLSATYADGVLEVHVRKPQEPKPRRIQIGGQQHPTIEGSVGESHES
jgi:HSP20 family protein